MDKIFLNDKTQRQQQTRERSKQGRDVSQSVGAAGRWELAAHRTQRADAPRDGTTHPNTNASIGHDDPVSATEVTPR